MGATTLATSHVPPTWLVLTAGGVLAVVIVAVLWRGPKDPDW